MIHKYRAWNKIDKVMIYDLNSPKMVHGVLVADSDDILLKFAGLLDKEKIEAYEGDKIISDNIFTEGVPLIIEFEQGCFIGKNDKIKLILAEQPFEIIGNKYEGVK